MAAQAKDITHQRKPRLWNVDWIKRWEFYEHSRLISPDSRLSLWDLPNLLYCEVQVEESNAILASFSHYFQQNQGVLTGVWAKKMKEILTHWFLRSAKLSKGAFIDDLLKVYLFHRRCQNEYIQLWSTLLFFTTISSSL